MKASMSEIGAAMALATQINREANDSCESDAPVALACLIISTLRFKEEQRCTKEEIFDMVSAIYEEGIAVFPGGAGHEQQDT